MQYPANEVTEIMLTVMKNRANGVISTFLRLTG